MGRSRLNFNGVHALYLVTGLFSKCLPENLFFCIKAAWHLRDSHFSMWVENMNMFDVTCKRKYDL